MKGDKIVVEAQHRRLGNQIARIILPKMTALAGKYVITVAGESGSGKSTTAAALAAAFEEQNVSCVILQQDDYYVYPPKTNDQMRRQDKSWHGIREVRLELLDRNIKDILDGNPEIEKPLIIYGADRIDKETINVQDVQVIIIEGGYSTLLQHVHTRVFIERTYLDTRFNREKRARYQAELDEFTENILKTEHEIISKHKAQADIVITKDYQIRTASV